MANDNTVNPSSTPREHFYPIHPDCNNPCKKVLVKIDETSYREIMPDIWKQMKQNQRYGFCRCPRKQLCYCDADCNCCYWGKGVGNTVSLSDLLDAEDDVTYEQTIAANEDGPEEIATKDFMRYALRNEIKEIPDPVEKKIAVLILYHGMTEREAAEAMGMPRSTLKYRWNKIQDSIIKKWGG